MEEKFLYTGYNKSLYFVGKVILAILYWFKKGKRNDPSLKQ